MSKLTHRLAAVATLALAALPVAALTTTAHAAEYRVPVGDLQLGTAAGAARFDARLKMAVNALCEGQRGVTARSACESSVRAEAMDQLSAGQRRQLAWVQSFAAR